MAGLGEEDVPLLNSRLILYSRRIYHILAMLGKANSKCMISTIGIPLVSVLFALCLRQPLALQFSKWIAIFSTLLFHRVDGIPSLSLTVSQDVISVSNLDGPGVANLVFPKPLAIQFDSITVLVCLETMPLLLWRYWR